MLIKNVEVEADSEFGVDELTYYVDLVKNKFPHDTILTLKVSAEIGDRVALHYTKQGEKFERIRRITGYLTGDLNTWNDAKRVEEHDRVKHN